MAVLSADTLRGVWATVLLPLREDDSIDEDRLSAQLHVLVDSGLDGLYAHGTAGELHTLDDAERDLISHLLAERCAASGTPYQIGAAHPFAQQSLRLIERARLLSPGAIQVILPDWVAPSFLECVTFLERAAAVAAPVPLVLYNPPHAKTVLTPSQLVSLLEAVPALIGLKTAGGDDDWYDGIRAVADRWAIFVPGHLLASGHRRGARGSYSNVAALSPRGAVAWWQLIRADPEAALDLQRRLGRFLAEHVAPLQADRIGNPALDKFLACVGGWADVGTRVRWPYRSVPADRVAPAYDRVRQLVPELFPIDSMLSA